MRRILDQLPAAIREFVGAIDQVDVPDQGDTSEVFIVSGPRGRFVVKHVTKPPFGEWLMREYDVLRSIALSGLPVPRPHLYLEQDSPAGRSHWLLMEYVPGIPLRTRLRREGDAAVRRRLLFQFGELLARIHAESVPEELISPEPWLDRMLNLAGRYLRDHEVDGDAGLLDHLRTNRPTPVPPCLIHGDYTLDNVLFSGERVRGVIDWCWGAFGDPRYDLAVATRAEPEAFGEPADLDAFYAGYAGRRLTQDEASYFLGLYEFF